ncbi:hypothetical protein [Aquimarina megaterium]|uniref:hypothetical protein n=1 Tax=Aquimarina megaterium TaxID=1443666 RepID=UPI001267C93B|nr:hypothetical protein [Aquimarina megaterium]
MKKNCTSASSVELSRIAFLIQNSCHPEYIEGFNTLLPLIEALELTNFELKNLKCTTGCIYSKKY